MALDLPGIELKHAEFAELFEAFAHDYLDSDEGRAHMAAYPESRTRARANFERILALRRSDAASQATITDEVLDGLLPYADTAANREAGRWISVAPALKTDVRVRYEAAGWTDPEDWPKVAAAVLDFVRRVVADASTLADACAEFAALPYTKGFQAGMLSPILNALRPNQFAIVNGKSRQVINYFAGTAYRSDLMDYPDLNATAFRLIDALFQEMHKLDVDDGSDVDLLDAFCHWLITARSYDFAAPEAGALLSEDYESSAAPFVHIFSSREEAEWALDLMRETLDHLGVSGPGDKRLAVTWTRSGRTLRLNFGNWAILQFYGPCYRQFRVGLALMEEHLDVVGPYDMWRPFATEDDVKIRIYILPIETVRPLQGSLRRSYERALDYIAERFRRWRGSNYRRFHQAEIGEAIFDTAARDRLFEGPFCAVPTGDGAKSAAVAKSAAPAKSAAVAQPAVVAEHGEDYGLTPEVAPALTLDTCAEQTGVAVSTLEMWVDAIERKGQAILYGPPGTGKTYLAEMLARHLVGGGDGFWDLVQFHPAYAYEDFVQGLRPRVDEEGQLSYEMVPGRLMEFCDRARRVKDACVLIIDEINRADLSRVFGEAMYLLEYRDRSIPLAGRGRFSIPDNVRILGTMNTADRSIALVDHALRRRFAFLPVYPDYDVLRYYHGRHETGFLVEELIEVLQEINQHIGDPHTYIGITFFLQEKLDEHLRGIWRTEIEPYLEELFFDRPELVEEFRWARVAPRIR